MQIDATLFMLRYSCALLAAEEEKETYQIAGAGIVLDIVDRRFILTAGHVATDNDGASGLFYLKGDLQGQVSLSSEFIGSCSATSASDSKVDKADLALLEIPVKPFPVSAVAVPAYMIARSPTLDHVERFHVMGYPWSMNKPKFRQRGHKLKSLAMDLAHADSSYIDLGLNPVTHFCARFDKRSAVDSTGRKVIAPDPYGLSGAPVWHLGDRALKSGTDEGAQLVGLVSEWDYKRGLIWGPRITWALLSLSDAIPEFSSEAWRTKRIRTFDPKVAEHFARAVAIGPQEAG